MNFEKEGLIYKAQFESFKGFTDIMCQFMEGPVKRSWHEDYEPNKNFYPWNANYLVVVRPAGSDWCNISIHYRISPDDGNNSNLYNDDDLDSLTVYIKLKDGNIEIQNDKIDCDVDKIKLDTIGNWLEHIIAKLPKGKYYNRCKYLGEKRNYCDLYEGYTIPTTTEWSMMVDSDEEEWNEEEKYLLADIEFFGLYYQVQLPSLKGFTDLYCQLNEKSCDESDEYIEPRKELYPENANHVEAFVKYKSIFNDEVVEELKGAVGIIISYINNEDNRLDVTIKLTISLTNGEVRIDNLSGKYKIHRYILVSIRKWLKILTEFLKGMYCTNCKYFDELKRYCNLFHGYIKPD